MADYLFVPQTVLDRWSEKGKVSVEGHVLTLLGEKAGDKKVFALTAAVRFLKMEAGDDVSGLLQKVKTVEALKQMGAEHYLESVILGDNAYQVQQGFLADANAIRRALEAGADPKAGGKGAAIARATSPGAMPEHPPRASEAAPTPAAPAAVPGSPPVGRTSAPGAQPAKHQSAADAKKSGEPDMLAQFFLDNLT